MSVLKPLRALLDRLKEEDDSLTKKIDILMAKVACIRNDLNRTIENTISSPEESQECYNMTSESFQLLCEERICLRRLQRKVRFNIRVVSKIIKENKIGFDNFPVIMDIELAELLSDGGRVEDNTNDCSRVSAI